MSDKILLAPLQACARDGLSLREAAERLGWSVASVWRAARRHRVKFRTPERRCIGPVRDKIIAAIRAGHVTAPAITAHLGLPREDVRRISVALQRMYWRGIVARGRPDHAGLPYRPPLKWKLRTLEAAE